MGNGGVSVTVDGRSATVTFHRPPENVLDRETVVALESRLREVARRRDVRLVALAARGEDFCNGTEILPPGDDKVTSSIPGFASTMRLNAGQLPDAMAPFRLSVLPSSTSSIAIGLPSVSRPSASRPYSAAISP